MSNLNGVAITDADFDLDPRVIGWNAPDEVIQAAGTNVTACTNCGATYCGYYCTFENSRCKCPADEEPK